MKKIFKMIIPIFFSAIFLAACNRPETDATFPTHSSEDTASVQQEDFVGEWHRTNTARAYSGTVTIKNQTEDSFDFSFCGYYAANSGEIEGTAIFTGENIAKFHHIPEYDKTIFAKVEFVLEQDSLQISLMDGSDAALGFGHNVSLNGAYTKSEPVYVDADIVSEILPTEDIREKMRTLLGDDVYEQVVFVIEYGVRYPVEDLTYSGFVSGAGEGVDLYLDGDKIYCLGYGLDSDGFVYKLYTNDEEYRDKLPPFMKIDRTDYEIQFVYKP